MAGTDRLVSIIITTHYRNDQLQRAIDRARAQTFDPIEIIVVDDSGEAHARPVVDVYDDVTYVPHSENRGAIAARQTGFDSANGVYIQFHDDDDWLAETKIEKQIEVFQKHENTGVVYCGAEHDDGTVVLPDEEKRGNVAEAALRLYDLYPCQTTTMLVRSAVLKSVLPLPNYTGAFDYALSIRLAQRTRFEFVAEPLVYRIYTVASKGSSLQTRRAHLEVVRDHEHLYAEHPDLKRETLAEAYWHLGHAYLNERKWSAKAILAFARANTLARSVNPRYLALLVCSLGGQWGRRMCRRMAKVL